jgi:hypothetical protein
MESITEMNAIDTLATGNFPFVRAVWIVKYRARPRRSTNKPKMTVVAPNGLANTWIRFWRLSVAELNGWLPAVDADIVNSWTRATPVDAMARLVLTYARKVLSDAK